jgi:hypothetical protein
MSGLSLHQQGLRTLAGGALLALALSVAGAVPARGAGPARPWDFNGDGRPDTAVGIRGENAGAGAVAVFRGTATGLSSSGVQRISQSSPGVPGAPEAGDSFGASLASGDFDGDGYADLAVGAPGEDTTADESVGAVAVLYGTANGLSGSGAHALGRPAAPFGEADPEEDELGTRLTAADFDGDGDHDLAVAITSGSNGLLIYQGRAAGLSTQPSTSVGPGHGLPAELGSQPMRALAVGDLDGNGRPDLAIGMQEYEQARGAVAVVYSAKGSGLNVGEATVPSPQVWTEDSDGVRGTAADLDAFGAAVGIGDVSGDGRKDLVVTVLQQPTSTPGAIGAIHVLRGGSEGVHAEGDQYLPYDSVVEEPVGAMGVAVGVGDLNGDGIAEVAVTHGVHPDSRFGGVTVLKGSAAGLRTAGRRSFTQASAGIGGTTSGVVDYWGAYLRIGDAGKSRHRDLIVSDPYQAVGGAQAGMVNILWGSDANVAGSRSDTVTQDSPGVPGASENGDLFGADL